MQPQAPKKYVWRKRLFQSRKPRKTHPQKALQTRPAKNNDKEEYAKRKVRPEHEAKSMVCGEGLPVTSQPASHHTDGCPCPALASFLKETRWWAVLWAVSHHQSALLPFSDTAPCWEDHGPASLQPGTDEWLCSRRWNRNTSSRWSFCLVACPGHHPLLLASPNWNRHF